VVVEMREERISRGDLIIRMRQARAKAPGHPCSGLRRVVELRGGGQGATVGCGLSPWEQPHSFPRPGSRHAILVIARNELRASHIEWIVSAARKIGQAIVASTRRSVRQGLVETQRCVARRDSDGDFQYISGNF